MFKFEQTQFSCLVLFVCLLCPSPARGQGDPDCGDSPPCIFDKDQNPIAFDCFSTINCNSWGGGPATFEVNPNMDEDTVIQTSDDGNDKNRTIGGEPGNGHLELNVRRYFSVRYKNISPFPIEMRVALGIRIFPEEDQILEQIEPPTENFRVMEAGEEIIACGDVVALLGLDLAKTNLLWDVSLNVSSSPRGPNGGPAPAQIQWDYLIFSDDPSECFCDDVPLEFCPENPIGPCDQDPSQSPIAFDCFATNNFNDWDAGTASFQESGDVDTVVQISTTGNDETTSIVGDPANGLIDLNANNIFSVKGKNVSAFDIAAQVEFDVEIDGVAQGFQSISGDFRVLAPGEEIFVCGDVLSTLGLDASQDNRLSNVRFHVGASPDGANANASIEWDYLVFSSKLDDCFCEDAPLNRCECPGVPFPDRDGDGIADRCDNCPDVDDEDQEDFDGDGIGDACDNCPDNFNEDQLDCNGNGDGDECDLSDFTCDTIEEDTVEEDIFFDCFSSVCFNIWVGSPLFEAAGDNDTVILTSPSGGHTEKTTAQPPGNDYFDLIEKPYFSVRAVNTSAFEVTTQVAAGVNLVDGAGVQGRRDLFDRTLAPGEVLLECGNIFESPAIVSFGIDGSEPTLLHEMAVTVRNNDGLANAEISWDYIIFSSNPLDCFTEDVPLTRRSCDATEEFEVSCADGVDNDCDGLTDTGDPDCPLPPPLLPPCNVDPEQDPIAFDCFATTTFNTWVGSPLFEAARDNDTVILTSPSGGHMEKTTAQPPRNGPIDLIDKPYFSVRAVNTSPFEVTTQVAAGVNLVDGDGIQGRRDLFDRTLQAGEVLLECGNIFESPAIASFGIDGSEPTLLREMAITVRNNAGLDNAEISWDYIIFSSDPLDCFIEDVPLTRLSCGATEEPEVSCADGVDNDCDGLIDTGDPDCPPPPPPPPLLPPCNVDPEQDPIAFDCFATTDINIWVGSPLFEAAGDNDTVILTSPSGGHTEKTTAQPPGNGHIDLIDKPYFSVRAVNTSAFEVTTQVAAGVNLVDGAGIRGRRDLFDRTLQAGEVLLECGNIFESPAIASFGIDGSEPTLLHEMAITVRNNAGLPNAEISWDYIIFSSDPLDCFTEDVPLTRLPCVATEGSEVSCADGIDNDCDGLTDTGDPDCEPPPPLVPPCNVDPTQDPIAFDCFAMPHFNPWVGSPLFEAAGDNDTVILTSPSGGHMEKTTAQPPRNGSIDLIDKPYFSVRAVNTSAFEVTTQVAAGVNLVDGDGIQGRRDLFDRTLQAGEVLLECGNIFESPAIASFGIDGSEPTLLHEMAITVRNNDGLDNAEISWDYIIFSSDPLDCFTEDVPLTRLPCDATEDSEVSCADGIDNDCDGLADDADPDCVPVGTVFRRGDCDQSGKADFNDAIFHLRFLFLGDNTEVVEGCPAACDSDDSGEDDFTDDINLLKFLFLGQGTIPDPGPLPDESHPCGLDPTLEDPEELTCDTYLPAIACP